MNDLTSIVSLGGWILASLQFLFSYRENKLRNDEKLLEQTLGYFERGTQARSIGISLTEGIWLRRRKYLNIIVPVLVSQLFYLLRDAENFGQESRNLIRMLNLLEKALPLSQNHETERLEVLEALHLAGTCPGKISVSKNTLRIWYEKFGGNIEMFDIETLQPIGTEV